MSKKGYTVHMMSMQMEDNSDYRDILCCGITMENEKVKASFDKIRARLHADSLEIDGTHYENKEYYPFYNVNGNYLLICGFIKDGNATDCKNKFSDILSLFESTLWFSDIYMADKLLCMS